MEESQNKKKLSPLYTLVLILGILLVSFVCSYLGSLLNKAFHTGVFDFAVVFVLSFFGLWVYRTFVADYRYRLQDGRLFIEAVNGKRTRLLFVADLKKARDFIPALHPYPLWHRFYIWTNTNTRRQLVYKKDKKNKRIVFAPSEEMVQEIRKIMHAKH